MKNIILVVIVLAIVVAGYLFLNRSSDTTDSVQDDLAMMNSNSDNSEIPSVSTATMETGTYTADVVNSAVVWQAGKPSITGYVHTGMFLLQSGSVELSSDDLSGEFVVDINSLRILSLGGGKDGAESALEGHLKGSNFFDATNYGTATFKIQDITPKVLPGIEQSEYTATGELTMKGQTKTLIFPVKVIVSSENEVWLTAMFELDRTEWGINFGSAKITDRITDQIIGDTVNMELTVRLEK